MVHALHCLQYEAFGPQPVQVVLIQDNTRPSGYELVRVSTDLKASAAELIERYAQRWPTEVAYEEGKHLFGVGEARNRAENAVQRTVPLPVPDDDAGDPLVRTLRPSPRRRRRAPPAPPLVLSKTNPSCADMLAKLRRVIIACQFHPGQGRAPRPAEITQVQQAWAAAGL